MTQASNRATGTRAGPQASSCGCGSRRCCSVCVCVGEPRSAAISLSLYGGQSVHYSVQPTPPRPPGSAPNGSICGSRACLWSGGRAEKVGSTLVGRMRCQDAIWTSNANARRHVWVRVWGVWLFKCLHASSQEKPSHILLFCFLFFLVVFYSVFPRGYTSSKLNGLFLGRINIGLTH